MKQSAMIALAAVATVGCHGTPPESTPPVMGAGQCDASRVQALIGSLRGDAVTAQARTRSGAGIVRYLTPGMITTKEYRQDRLNLHVDADGRIVSAACG